MIEESYVSFDTARMLKEAGFNAPCYMQYSDRGVQWEAAYPDNFNANDWGCSCPTQALAARWLRETHKLHVWCEIGQYGYCFTALIKSSHTNNTPLYLRLISELLKKLLKQAYKKQ